MIWRTAIRSSLIRIQSGDRRDSMLNRLIFNIEVADYMIVANRFKIRSAKFNIEFHDCTTVSSRLKIEMRWLKIDSVRSCLLFAQCDTLRRRSNVQLNRKGESSLCITQDVRNSR